MTCQQSTQVVPDDNGDAIPQTATERFLAFHRANPQVYVVLRRLAREYLGRGKRKCGIDLLWNTARWVLTMDIEGEDVFELNNNHQPFYARALMYFDEDLAGLFDTRRSPEADAWIASVKAKAVA